MFQQEVDEPIAFRPLAPVVAQKDNYSYLVLGTFNLLHDTAVASKPQYCICPVVSYFFLWNLEAMALAQHTNVFHQSLCIMEAFGPHGVHVLMSPFFTPVLFTQQDLQLQETQSVLWLSHYSCMIRYSGVSGAAI